MSTLLKPSDIRTSPTVKIVVNYYESDDILILRDALLLERKLKLDKTSGLVRCMLSNEPFKDKYHQFETYHVTPLSTGEYEGLQEIILFALLRSRTSAQQILFPYRMANLRHWVTGQILIKGKKIIINFHDSANYYQTTPREKIEEELMNFLKFELKYLMEFLRKPGRLIKEEQHKELMEVLYGTKDKDKSTFQIENMSRSGIFDIQKSGTYCGGYTTRLCISLTENPLPDLSKQTVWSCESENELSLRQADGLIVEKHCKDRIEKYGSRSEGREYIGSATHQEAERKQKAESNRLITDIEQILLKTSNEIIRKISQKALLITNSSTHQKIRELYCYCKNDLQLANNINPVTPFFSNPSIDINENSLIKSDGDITVIWEQFIQILKKYSRPIFRAQDFILDTSHYDGVEADITSGIKGLKFPGFKEPKFKKSITFTGGTKLTSGMMFTSGLPQAAVVKVANLEHMAIKTTFSFTNKSSLAEDIQIKGSQGVGQKTRETLPDLIGTDLHLSWYKNHLGCLRDLLKMAQTTESCQGVKTCDDFSDKDLKYVIDCGNPRNLKFSILSVFDREVKMVRLSTKILSYLAQNKKKLSTLALDLLIEKMDHQDNKISFNAVMGLCYTIINGQDLSNTTSIENVWIDKIAKKIRALMKHEDVLFHIADIVVGLAAVTKKKIQLLPDDFEFIKKTLAIIGYKTHRSHFPITEMHSFIHPKSRIAWYRTALVELSYIKKLVKKGSHLANDEIKYAVRCFYEKAGDKHKRKSIQILRYLIRNKQRNFPIERKKVIDALEKAFTNPDRKMKANSLVAMGYLVNGNGKEKENYASLRKSLNIMMSECRLYALQALNHHIQFYDRDHRNIKDFPNIKNILEILNSIIEDEDLGNVGKGLAKDVGTMARIIISRLTQDITTLTKLLLEYEHCVEVTEILLSNVQLTKCVLPKDVLINMVNILLNVNHHYPMAAKCNVVSILRHVAENKHSIPEKSLDALHDYLAKEAMDHKVYEEACHAFGYYTLVDMQSVLNDRVLHFLLHSLKLKESRLSAAFALKNILQEMVDKSFNTYFSNVIELASSYLTETRADELEIKVRLALILLHSAKKGFVFRDKVQNELAVVLNAKENVAIRKRLIESIQYIIESGNLLTFNLLESLVKLYDEKSFTLHGDVTNLIKLYIEKRGSALVLPESMMQNFTNMLKQHKHAFNMSIILRELVNQNKILPVESFVAIMTVLGESDHGETQINLAWIFNKLSAKFTYNGIIFTQLFAALQKIENKDVLELLVAGFKVISQKKLHHKPLPDGISQKLAEIVIYPDNRSEYRLNAADILYHYSNFRYFNTDVLWILKNTLSDSDIAITKIVILTLGRQVMFLHRLNYSQEIIEITKEVEKIVFRHNLTLETLFFLKDVSSKGYNLSEKTLEFVGKQLLDNNDKTIRELASEILRLAKSILPEGLFIIRQLEHCGQELVKDSNSIDAKKKQLLLMAKHAHNGQRLTKNNLDIFATLLKEESPLFSQIFYTIYCALINAKQELIPVITQKLCSFLMKVSGSDLEYVALSLCHIAKNGEYLPFEVFENFETLILIKEHDKFLLDFLNILEIATKRGKVFKKETILRLIGLLLHQNAQMHSPAAKVLNLVSKKQDIQFCLHKIIVTLVQQEYHDETSTLLSDAIKMSVLKDSRLDENSIEYLYEILKNGCHNKTEDNIIDIFELLTKNQKISEEILHLLRVRNSEKILANCQMETSISESTAILCLHPQYISQKSFDIFEKRLKDGNEAVRKLVLKRLIALQGMIDVPSAIFVQVSMLIQEKPYSKLAIEFIFKSIKRRKKIPKEAIDNIIQVLLFNVDGSIRNDSFNVSQRLEKSQLTLEQVRMLTVAEKVSDSLSLPRINQLTLQKLFGDIKKASFPVSFDLCQLFLKLLKIKNHFSHTEIINFLFREKEKIPSIFHSRLLNLLIGYEKNSKIESKITALCLYILQTNKLKPENLTPLLKCIERKLALGTLNSEKFNVFRLLLSRTSSSLSIAFENIINGILATKMEKRQLDLLQLLFSIAKKNGKLSKETFLVLLVALDQMLHDTQCRNFSSNIRRKIFGIIAFVLRRQPTLLGDFKEEVLERYVEKRLLLSPENMLSSKKFSLYSRTLMFLTLISLDTVDKSIYNHSFNSESTFSRYLLCKHLLEKSCKDSDVEESAVDQKVFFACLEELENVRNQKNKPDEVNNLLILLIDIQEREKVNIKTLIQYLVLLKNPKINAEQLLIEDGDLFSNWQRKFLEIFIHEAKYKAEEIDILLPLLKQLKWQPSFTNLFFNRVAGLKSATTLVKFLNFICQYKITEEKLIGYFEEMDQEETDLEKSIVAWRFALEKEMIIAQIIAVSNFVKQNKHVNKYIYTVPNFVNLLSSKVLELVKRGYSFDTLFAFLREVREKVVAGTFYNIDAIYNAFDITFSYKLSEKYFVLFQEVFIDPLKAIVSIHKSAMLGHFTDEENEKDLDTILKEFRTNGNERNAAIARLLPDSLIREIIYHYEIKYKEIEEWTETDISRWAEDVRDSKKIEKVENLYELLPCILAIIKRATILLFGQELRKVQILAVLVFIFSTKNMGRLSEIITGEGKSLIIAVLVVICGLRNESVDIITNAPDFAREAIKFFNEFFEWFTLKAACNEDVNYEKGLKPCYAKDVQIIYGCISDFQFDLLREEYYLLGTRGKRKFDRVIVDEADNLLINEGAKIAMIAGTMSGFDYLKPLLICIAKEINQIEADFFEQNGALLYHTETLERDGYVAESVPSQDKNSIVEKRMLEYIDNITKDKISIPIHLKEFVKIQSKKWIRNALLSLTCADECEYSLERNKEGLFTVTPVDAENTGVFQRGTNWGDGLQQFIQIKHGLEVTSESLVVNFISNMAYILKYKDKLYCLTGTAGSIPAQEFLSQVYNIDFAFIPTYKPKKLMEYTGIVALSEGEWFNEIEAATRRELDNGRVILHLCENIKQARRIKTRIEKNSKANIKLCISNGDELSQLLSSVLEENTVIIATTVAGRAADLKPSRRVIRNGGMHVCFTFLPSSISNHCQGLGRAGRCGAPGSGQLILCKEHVIKKLWPYSKVFIQGSEELTFDNIIRLRNEKEKDDLETFKNAELPRTIIKDKLYKKFRAMLKKIKKSDKTDESFYKYKAIEERWGIWLKAQDETLSDETLTEFLKFRKEILTDYKNNCVIKNPFYYINQATDMLVYANSYWGKIKTFFSNKTYTSAIESLNKAIELDPDFSYMAHYNKIFALVKSKPKGYKNLIKKHARTLIDTVEKSILPITMVISDKLNTGFKVQPSLHIDLAQQIKNRIQALHALLESAYQIIAEVERSQRLIDVEIVKSKEVMSFKKLNKKQARNTINCLNPFIVHPDQSLSVCFHDLKASSDMWTSYQAKETIEKGIGRDVNISIIFEDESDKEKLKKLLPINRDKENPKETNTEKPEADKDKNSGDDKEKKEKNESLTFGDRLSTLRDGAVDFFNEVADTAGAIVAPFKGIVNKARDSIWDYTLADTLLVNLQLSFVNFEEAFQSIKIISQDENEQTACRITLILGKMSREYVEGLLKSNCGLVMRIKSKQVKEHQNVKRQCTYETFSVGEYVEGCLIEIEAIKHNEFKDLITKIEQIFEKLPNYRLLINSISITLKISNVKQNLAEKIIDKSKGPVTLSFENLNKKAAVPIIYLTEKRNQDATFKINNLTTEEAQTLIEKASRIQQHFNVNLRPIENVVLRLKESRTELNEYHLSGIIYLYDISEQNPMPWKSIFSLTLLSVVQIVGGILLTGVTFGIAANVGIGLVGEGIGDLMRVCSAVYSREFSWGSYVVQKSISIGLSLMAASQVARLSQAGTVGQVGSVSAELVDDVAMQAAQLMSRNVSKQGFQVAVKEILTTTAKTVATSTANHLATHLIDVGVGYGLTHIQEMVLNDVRIEMNKRIITGIWKVQLNKLFVLDRFLDRMGSDRYEEKIFVEVDHFIKLMSIENLGIAALTAETFSKFDQEFSKILESHIAKIPSFPEILYQRHLIKGSKFSMKEIEDICQILLTHKILTADGSIILEANEESDDERVAIDSDLDQGFLLVKVKDRTSHPSIMEVDFGFYARFKGEIIEDCQDYSALQNMGCAGERRALCEKLTHSFSNQLFRVFEYLGEHVKVGLSELASYGIGKIAQKISEPTISQDFYEDDFEMPESLSSGPKDLKPNTVMDVPDPASTHSGSQVINPKPAESTLPPSKPLEMSKTLEATKVLEAPKSQEAPRPLEASKPSESHNPLKSSHVEYSSRQKSKILDRSQFERDKSKLMRSKESIKHHHKSRSHDKFNKHLLKKHKDHLDLPPVPQMPNSGKGKQTTRGPLSRPQPVKPQQVVPPTVSPAEKTINLPSKSIPPGLLPESRAPLPTMPMPVKPTTTPTVPVPSVPLPTVPVPAKPMPPALPVPTAPIPPTAPVPTIPLPTMPAPARPAPASALPVSAPRPTPQLNDIGKLQSRIDQRLKLYTDADPGLVQRIKTNPTKITVNSSATSMAMKVTVSMIEKHYIHSLQQNLERDLEQRRYLSQLETARLSKQCCMQCRILLEEKRKIIKSFIGLILIEKQTQVSIAMSETKPLNFTEFSKIMDEDVEALFRVCMQDPSNGHMIVIKHLYKISLEHRGYIKELLNKLKGYFDDFNDTYSKERTMSTLAMNHFGKMDVHQLTKQIFKELNLGNYSICGMLLQTGKISDKGFLIGSTIEAIGDALLISSIITPRAKAELQLGMVEVMRQVLQHEEGFRTQALKTQGDREELILLLAKRLNVHLRESIQCSIEAIKSRTPELIENAKKRVLVLKEGAIPALRELFKNSKIDPDFISNCVEASSSLMVKLLETTALVKEKDTAEIKKLIEASLAANESLSKMTVKQVTGHAEIPAAGSDHPKLMSFSQGHIPFKSESVIVDGDKMRATMS